MMSARSISRTDMDGLPRDAGGGRSALIQKQMACREESTLIEHEPALHHVLKLADIAWPIILEKMLNGILTHARKRLIVAATMLANEMLDQ